MLKDIMGMETIYAALLLHEVKQPANEENLKKVLQASGAQVDDAIIKATVASLENVNIEDAIANASVVAAPAAISAAPETHKKEEKKKEEVSDDAAAGLGALFG